MTIMLITDLSLHSTMRVSVLLRRRLGERMVCQVRLLLRGSNARRNVRTVMTLRVNVLYSRRQSATFTGAFHVLTRRIVARSLCVATVKLRRVVSRSVHLQYRYCAVVYDEVFIGMLARRLLMFITNSVRQGVGRVSSGL